MAVEMEKEQREVFVRPDGKYAVHINQVQVYDKDNVDTMLSGWTKKKAEYQEWLSKYDQHVADGTRLMKEQLELQKSKIEGELKNLDEGILMWSNAERNES